jgi:hypothetical protein
MFDFPKLVFLAVVFAGLWWLFRRVGRLAQESARRPQAYRGERSAPRRAHSGYGPAAKGGETEDLVLCGVCGSYVAAGAPGCVRPDCPRPR